MKAKYIIASPEQLAALEAEEVRASNPREVRRRALPHLLELVTGVPKSSAFFVFMVIALTIVLTGVI